MKIHPAQMTKKTNKLLVDVAKMDFNNFDRFRPLIELRLLY